MSFFCSKHLIFSFLLINFTFSYPLVEPQTLLAPDFDEALLPFGSLAITGTFSRSCNRHDFDRAAFTVLNQCSFTVWAAAIPGGGRRLLSGDTWTFNVPSYASGRVWARTNCSFDSSGRGNCETGDCGGLLQCKTFGSPPNTLAEFALDQLNVDFFDVSLVDGFNIPMEFRPTSNGCSKGVRCVADINGQCPSALRTAGGCNNPCQVFQTEEYCCTNSSMSCGPTDYSRYFKERCPSAYSYPKDDATSIFSCPGGTHYDVVFCPP